MDVILLENIHNVGKLGDQVAVKPGFARNFLLPQGKAVNATPENVKKFEARRAELEKAAAELLHAAQKRADEIAKVVLKIPAQAGEEGKLFGSIGTRDLAEAITAAGAAVEKSEVLLPEGPLRRLGEYDIALQVHSDITTTVKVHIVSDEEA